MNYHGYKQDNQEALGRFVRRNAMRQMRWFERAVAGELAEHVAGGRQPPIHASQHPLPAPSTFPPPPIKPSAGLTSPTRKGSLATRPTVAEAPNSRKRGRGAAEDATGKPKDAEVGGTAGKPPTPAGTAAATEPVEDESNIDWGDEGPTLIQKSEAARRAIEKADRKAGAGQLSG